MVKKRRRAAGAPLSHSREFAGPAILALHAQSLCRAADGMAWMGGLRLASAAPETPAQRQRVCRLREP